MTGNASVTTVGPVSLVRRLPADRTAPGAARETTRTFLRGLATGDETDTAMLLVSELVTNSVAASAGMAGAYVGLSLRAVSTHLFVRVIDSAPGFPEVATPAIGDEHGYGLFVVQGLSARYGWFPMSGGRKYTYFLLYLENGTEGEEE
jgi:anti-sigma regulatory factor (Ser/Thr protein kinase)